MILFPGVLQECLHSITRLQDAGVLPASPRYAEIVRSVLLFLSRQRQLRRWAETSPFAEKLARRFIAGNDLDRALTAARKIHSGGLRVTLDHLGENVTSLAEAAASRDEALRELSALSAASLEANVSIKLTQFGLDLDPAACERNVAAVAAAARALPGGFVRVDMEASEYTDRTLSIVKEVHREFGSIGTVIQSYLHRSEADVADLNQRGIRVRLCKGAYLEPATIAYPDKSGVDANYLRLMRTLLADGVYPAIATHDEAMIRATRAFATAQKIPADRFEFQMLYGIRRDLQRKLVAAGYRVRLYVPYGEAWYPYFMRRLAERPANVLFMARNLLR